MSNTQNGLIIVESPSKAKTLKKFLGDEYTILASVGHIRDLPKKDLGIDLDNDFKPTYVASPDKAKVIKQLKSEIKNVSSLYVATDPDREGEAIGWHLIEILKPTIPVKRLVFHEITKKAIKDSFNHTRDIDTSLVGAQESRRILDRLWGYLVSEKLWYNIKGGLSAGRVQSPAVKIVVDREKDRSRFIKNEYWGITGVFNDNKQDFQATLKSYDNKSVAIGKDFNKYEGTLNNKDKIIIDKDRAEKLVKEFLSAKWIVNNIIEKPSTQNPYPPFITSTLQQEGIRKLRMSSQAVMITAQKLYEAGYITYMRTDSITLSGEAINASREAIKISFGAKFIPNKPRVFKSKVKNAQEAHEAIRPSGASFVHPDTLKNTLEKSEWKLYNLIWKRTVASQMKSAKTLKTSIDICSNNAVFRATGKVIEFLGFLKVYVEDIDDPQKEKDDKETTLPKLTKGQNVSSTNFLPNQHFTKPSPRFTEASLVKELENLGIGRPSTYASIMSTIQKRGYVNKVKGSMIPTLTAYAVIQFLEKYFTDLVNLQFTADMENVLDSISRSEMQSIEFLNNLYNGNNGKKGLKDSLESEFDKKISRTIMVLTNGTSDLINVKIGRYGAYLQSEDKSTNLYDDFIPSDLNYKTALDLLNKKNEQSEPSYTHPKTNDSIYLKDGRFGPYLQSGKKMKSLLPGMTLQNITEKIAIDIISLPTKIGKHPDGDIITKDIGRYGPYLRCGKKTGKISSHDDFLDLDLNRAIEIIDTGNKNSGPTVIKVVGKMPNTETDIEIKDGRYGAYVTDGKINATIPKGEDVNLITLERAVALILEKKAKGPIKRFKRKK